MISVCIVSSRAQRLDECLASLQAQEDPPEFELLVGAHRSADVPGVALKRFPGATVGVVKTPLTAAARNLLVERARGDILLFLDDDVNLPPRLLRRLANMAEANPDVDVFGGPNLTPPGSSGFQLIEGEVLGSLVASGPVRRRYARYSPRHANQRHFMTCNLAIRRTAMRPFAGTLICAEENGILSEMSRTGSEMLYDPNLFVYHDRRPDYRTYARQMLNYGRGRGQLLVLQPQSLLPAAVLPPLMLVYFLLVPLLAVLNPPLLLPLAAYLALVAVAAVRVGLWLKRPWAVPTAALLVLTQHVCYGLGIWSGLVEGFRRTGAGQFEWAPVMERDADPD